MSNVQAVLQEMQVTIRNRTAEEAANQIQMARKLKTATTKRVQRNKLEAGPTVSDDSSLSATLVAAKGLVCVCFFDNTPFQLHVQRFVPTSVVCYNGSFLGIFLASYGCWASQLEKENTCRLHFSIHLLFWKKYKM